MPLAHRTALLRVKRDGEQSAVNPVRECAWTKGAASRCESDLSCYEKK